MHTTVCNSPIQRNMMLQKVDINTEDERITATTLRKTGNCPWRRTYDTSSFSSVVADNNRPAGPSTPYFSHSLPPCHREITRRSSRSACLHQKLIIPAYSESAAKRWRCYLVPRGAPPQRRLPSRRTVVEQLGSGRGQDSIARRRRQRTLATDCATNCIESAGNKTSLADRERLNDGAAKSSKAE